MSIKIKQALTESFKKIESNDFDEDTIRTLLIVSREYLSFEGLVRELAHFIAHPKRDRGIFHKKVNARYAKLKLVDEQISNTSISKANISTDEELSNFLLEGISVDRIESKLFDILYQNGLDDIPESQLIKYTGLTKIDAKKILHESYIKIDNYYYLKVLKTEKMISLLKESSVNDLSEKDLKTIEHGHELIQRTRKNIDSLQKVIRGTISFDSVFQTNDLQNDFKVNFENVLNQFDIDSEYIKIIENNMSEILLCLMTLLHDSKFVFFDKNLANVYICSYYPNDNSKQNEVTDSINQTIYDYGVLALYINYEFQGKSNAHPLFVSDILIKDYIDRNDFMNQKIDQSISEIPWICAKRTNKKLTLETYS